MSIKMIIILSVLGLLLGGAGYAAYLGNGLQDMKFDKANENPTVTTSGFTIPIKVLVTNPSRLSIPINSIEYEATLASTGEVLARGNIERIEITKQKSTWINETANVKWDKTAEATAQLITQEKVPMSVNLKINIFGIIIPYKTEIDIKEAIAGKGTIGNLPIQNPTNNTLIPKIL